MDRLNYVKQGTQILKLTIIQKPSKIEIPIQSNIWRRRDTNLATEQVWEPDSIKGLGKADRGDWLPTHFAPQNLNLFPSPTSFDTGVRNTLIPSEMNFHANRPLILLIQALW